MSRGYIFEVKSESDFLGCMNQDDFNDFAGIEFNYAEDLKKSDAEDRICDLLRYFSRLGVEIDNDEGTGITTIVFDMDAKRKYFSGRFVVFQSAASSLSLDDFVGDKYDLKKLIEDDFDDAVFLDGSFMTLDRFVRTAICGKQYYIGPKVVLMH